MRKADYLGRRRTHQFRYPPAIFSRAAALSSPATSHTSRICTINHMLATLPLQARLQALRVASLRWKTMKRHFTRAVYCQTYRSINCTTRCDNKVASCVGKTVMKVRFQTKAHFFILRSPITFLGFLSSLTSTGYTNRIKERLAIRVHLFSVKTF